MNDGSLIGNAWSFTAEHNPKMDFLASLQYLDNIQGRIQLPMEIKSSQK